MCPICSGAFCVSKNNISKQKCGKIKWNISTPRLNALLHLHLEPIKAIVSRHPMKSNLEDGFTLRCFQRLSKPKVATQRCSW